MRNGKHYPMRPGTIVKRILNNSGSVPPMTPAQKIELLETLKGLRCGTPEMFARWDVQISQLRAQLAGQTPAAD